MQEIKQLIIVNRTYGVVSQTFPNGRFPTLTFINGSETVAPTKDLEVSSRLSVTPRFNPFEAIP